jgi:uncharacterized Tic20 family protein
MSASAQAQFRGATLAMHSCVGFALSAVAGFAVLAAGILMGPLALWWSRRSTQPRPEA